MQESIETLAEIVRKYLMRRVLPHPTNPDLNDGYDDPGGDALDAILARLAESAEALYDYAAEHGVVALLDHLGLDGLGNEVNDLMAERDRLKDAMEADRVDAYRRGWADAKINERNK